MSFVGGGATSSGGFAGETKLKTGFAGRRTKKLTPREKMNDLEKIGEELKGKEADIQDLIDGLDKREIRTEEDEILDDYADEILENVDLGEDLDLDRLGELISRQHLIDAIEGITQAERRDFVFQSLDEFGINPYEDDVELGEISFDEVRSILGESIATEWNDVMDGFGKIAEGIGQDTEIFGDLEAYSDIARSIISGDPKYLAEGVLEKLGVEFDDEGNFSLKDTLYDNLSPVAGRIIKKKIFDPLAKKISETIGETVGETIVDTEALAGEIMGTTEVREFESLFARGLAELGGQELGEAGAFLFEGSAPLFAVVGALQATGALTRIISSVLRKANMKHDAYVEENHQWFGTKPQWDWLKYTGALYDAISGTAELVGDIADRQDYLAGQTPRQRYEQRKELHNFAFRIYQDVIGQISNQEFDGALDFSGILKEARDYGTIAKNQYFRLSATEMARDLKFFLQDIIDGKVDNETALRPDQGDPLYRGLDKIDAEGLTLNEYLNEYNLQVLEDELTMYKDMEDRVAEASKPENVFDDEGRNIPTIEKEISDLETMIRRRSSKKAGDILTTQYHYSMIGGGQQRKLDQDNLKALQDTLADLEGIQTQRNADARNLGAQRQKVRNTLEKLGVTGFVKTDQEYQKLYEDALKERAEQGVEAPLRFQAYQKLKTLYGGRMSDDMLRKMAGYGQFRDSDLRFPISGTGSDTILSVLDMTQQDYLDLLEEEANLDFDSWYDDYLDNLQTL